MFETKGHSTDVLDTRLVYVDEDGDLWIAHPETGEWGWVASEKTSEDTWWSAGKPEMYEYLHPLNRTTGKVIQAQAKALGWFAG